MVVHSRIAGIDRESAASSGEGQPVGIIEFIRIEPADPTDETLLICLLGQIRQILPSGEITGKTVVVDGRESELAIVPGDSDPVHHRVDRGDIRETGGGCCADHNEGTLKRGCVHARDVDIRSKPLTSGITETLRLKSVSEFSGSHVPGNRLLESDRRRNRELSEILEVRGLIGTVVRHRDVRLRTPDHVVGPLHHHLIGGVFAEHAGENERILETLQDLFKRYPFLFTESVGHDP